MSSRDRDRRQAATLLERAAELEPSAALRRRVLGIADAPTRLDGFASRIGRLFDLAEPAVREILAAADDAGGDRFVAVPGQGIRLLHLRGGPALGAAHCGLVQLAAGRSMPEHRHDGLEQLLVLSGSAEETSGEVWQPGDLIVREAGSRHAFRALGDEPFLFAVVLHGGPRPSGD